MKPEVSVNDVSGYPCPKCNAALKLIEGPAVGLGAWCPKCHTVWRETDKVSLDDLDALPETTDR